MTWAFLDDHGNENEKLVEIGSAAAWYWACGLMYCRRKQDERERKQQRLDFIPAKAALTLFPDKSAARHIKAILRVGLWLDAEGGYIVNDYRKVYGVDGTEGKNTELPNRPSPSQLGGQARAAQASRGPAGTFQRRQPAGPAAASQRPAADTSRLVQPQPATRASGSGSNSGADPKEISRSSEDLPGIARAQAPAGEAAAAAIVVTLNSLDEALTVPIRARCEWLEAHQSMATWVQPERWPELQAVAQAFALATCREVNGRLGNYQRDAGVRAIVALYAAGYEQAELVRAVAQLVEEPWWRKEGASRGLSTLTIEVVRRIVTADPLAGELDPRVRKILAEREQRSALTQASRTGAA